MDQTATSGDEADVNTPLWKIRKGRNGEKYLTFAEKPMTSTQARSAPENGSDYGDGEHAPNEIRVYKIRWFILACISFANISNSINWIVYSSIADFTGKFYNVNYDEVNYLSLSYLLITIPAGFFSFWIADNFGVRTSISLGVWFNFIGSFVKLVSSIDSADGRPLVSSEAKYAWLLTGQCLCALAQPFIMFVTTKFANTWFADDQRALANTIALGANTVGILVGSFISPQIVNSSVSFVSEMCLLNLVSLIVALVPTIMTCFITRSTPKLPPSYSAIINSSQSTGQYTSVDSADQETSNFKRYFQQIGKLFKSKDFLLLFFSFGVSLGLFNALTTLIEQILCTRGYSDEDVGYFGGIMIVMGIIGSIIAGLILDKTKKFEETAKVCFAMSCLASIFFCIVQLYDNDGSVVYYLVLVSFACVGFFGLPLLPVCMEMSVECVYPIPEATSTGLLFMSGQFTGILMIILYPKTAVKLDPASYEYNFVQTCASVNGTSDTTDNLTVLDFKYQIYFQTACQVFVTLVFIVFFKCAYLRLRSERERLAEKILNTS